MGKLTNLNPSAPIADADIPSGIARDSEITTAINAHLTGNPHGQYLLRTDKAIDSETVDGIDSSRINFGEDWHKASGAYTSLDGFATSGFLDCYGGGGNFPPGLSHIHGFQTRHGNSSAVWGMQAGSQYNINNEFYFRTITANAWQPWRRIWNDGNFTPASHAQTFTPVLKGIGLSTGDISTITQANNCGLEAQSTNSSSAAYISFHRPGIWGIHLGLDTSNQLCVGGWSMGNVKYKIFHEGSLNFYRGSLPTAAIGANSMVLGWNSMEPGQGIAEICNYSGLGGGDAINFFRVPGAENSISIFHRVARIDKNGAYIQMSDSRVKSDISEAPGLSVILKLFPKRYKHWECTGFDRQKKELKLGNNFTDKIGFFAQEVKEILPESVVEPRTPEELYGMDYNVLIPCLVRSVQQLYDQMIELKLQLQAVSKK